MKIITNTLILLLFIMLSGCHSDPPPSDGELLTIYNKNIEDLEKIISLCENNASIRRVRVPKGDTTYALPKTRIAVSNIREIMLKLNISTVECVRVAFENNKFRGVRFSSYLSGYVGAGEVKGLEYSAPWTFNERSAASLKELIDSGQFKKINDNGWFIFHYKN